MNDSAALTAQQKQYIDDHFFEGAAYTAAQFAQLRSSAELDYLLQQHNWDGDNRVLQWLAASPLLSRAAALEMFWLVQPQEFRQYPLTQKLPHQAAQATFQLLQTLMNNYASGFYRQTARHFDPASYYAEPAAIPTDLYTPSHGEEPYLYWEESDVAALFGTDFTAALRRADRMDLYNLAHLTPAHSLDECVWLLLDHPLCERGIAQMLFWRLQYECPLLTPEHFHIPFIRRWQAGDWAQAHIAFTPTAPQTPPPAWDIPAVMYQAV